MMTSGLRVAMAGAGFASRLHLAGWRRVRDASVVAICDPDAVRAAERAAEFGIPSVFADAAAMLDAVRPDALDIVAPLNAHVPLCLLAASRGIHVMCQKPVAPTVADAQSLESATRGRIRLMVHENWRFRTQYRQIRQWLDSGRLGTPVSCLFTVRSSGLLPDADGVVPQLVRQPFFADLHRLLIAEVLIHQLDVLRWLLGPLQVVSARSGRLSDAVRGEDHAAIFLQGTGQGQGRGCWAVLDASLVAVGASPLPTDRLELLGTAGSAVFEGEEVRLSGEFSETVRVDLDAGYGDSYAAAIAHFASALSSGTRFETDLPDNLQTLALVDSAYDAVNDRDSQS